MILRIVVVSCIFVVVDDDVQRQPYLQVLQDKPASQELRTVTMDG